MRFRARGPKGCRRSEGERSAGRAFPGRADGPGENVDSGGWTLDIGPRRELLDLRLRELLRYRDLVLLLVHRELISTYKQTVLGPLWIVLQPLLTTLVFTLVFGKMAGLSTDGVPAIAFYMSGVTCWGYFSECLSRTAGTFIDNAHLFGKVYFPRLAVPLALVLSSLVRFLVRFAMLALVLAVYWLDGEAAPSAAAVPLVLPSLLILGTTSLGIGLTLSSITTKYRDLRHLLQFGVQLLMYATPVIYPVSSLAEGYRTLMWFNPLAAPIEAFRLAMTGAGEVSSAALAYSGLFAAATLVVGLVLFNRTEAKFMDTV